MNAINSIMASCSEKMGAGIFVGEQRKAVSPKLIREDPPEEITVEEELDILDLISLFTYKELFIYFREKGKERACTLEEEEGEGESSL